MGPVANMGAGQKFPTCRMKVDAVEWGTCGSDGG